MSYNQSNLPAFRNEPDRFCIWEDARNIKQLQKFTKVYEDFVSAWKNRDTITPRTTSLEVKATDSKFGDPGFESQVVH